MSIPSRIVAKKKNQVVQWIRFQRRHRGTLIHEKRPTSIPQILGRPLLFTSVFCLGSFGVVAIYDFEQYRKKQQAGSSTWKSVFLSIGGKKLTKSDSYDYSIISNWKDKLNGYLETSLPPAIRQEWAALLQDPRAKTVGPIIGLNVLVHALFCFRFPGLQAIRSRYFIHHADSGRALPLLLSNFAHSGILHLGFNSYVLWSFGDSAVDIVGGSRQQFWAAYCCAGTVASMGSILIDLTMNALRGFPMAGGLGASGAIMAIVFAFGISYPDTRIGIVGFPEEFSLPSNLALLGVAAFDLYGVLVGWQFLGHSSHLSGAMAGVYAVEMGGLEQIREYQRKVVRKYIQVRTDVA